MRAQVFRAGTGAVRIGFAVRSREGVDVHPHHDRDCRRFGCYARTAARDLRGQRSAPVEARLTLRDQGETAMDEKDRYDQGMTVRRAVLGDAHVERALARQNALTAEFQDLITRYAWGEIWTRPGLPRHTRSLLTIGLMVALNRGEEFRLHVRAAFNNGVTRDQIK